MTYLPFVDGLRAVAILAVVAFHAWPAALPGGFAGVDVFFVISGFLITRFIMSEMADGTFSLARFYVRRARRLLPAALVCFAVVAVVSAFVLLPDSYWYFGRSLLSALGMYANMFFYNTGGYFSAPSLEKPLLHTWSLAVEDQFYLTWPFVLIGFVPRVSRTVLLTIAAVLFAASLAFAEYKMTHDPEFAFFLLPTRAWELLTGATLALTASRLVLAQSVANSLAVAGALTVLASFALLAPDAHFPGLGALPACLGTAVIIASGLNQMTLISRALSLQSVVFVGLISYSLYLWHWPLIALASYHQERPLTALEAAAVVAVSLVAAILSWRYVERPFRKSPHASEGPALSPPDRRFAIRIALGVALMASVALVLKIEKGLPQRYNAGVRTALEQMVSVNPHRGSCDGFENIFANDDVCNVGRKKAPSESYEVALFGNLMADHWSSLVDKFAAEHALAARQVTNSACALLLGAEIKDMTAWQVRECSAYQRAAEQFIAANPGLKLAVISGFWERWLWGLEHPGQPYAEGGVAAATVPRPSPAPHFRALLRKTVEAFTSRGIKVLLIGQTPRYLTLPMRCAVANIAAGTATAQCGKPSDLARSELGASDAALTELARDMPLVSVALPSEFMCREANCALVENSTFLYKNGGHINRFGAMALGEFIAFPALK